MCTLLLSKCFGSNLQTYSKPFHFKETKIDLLSCPLFLCNYFQIHKLKHFYVHHFYFTCLDLFLLLLLYFPYLK